MHGRQPRFQPRHGGGARPLPAQPQVPLLNPNGFQNPNIYFQHPSLLSPLNQYIQSPNFSIQNPNLPIHNPTFSPHQLPNQVFQFQSSRPSEVLERIDRAVAKARSDLLIAGESVSAWKVSQSALLMLQTDSWDSLGFQLQQVPSLHRLMVIEGKINAFIHCFVGVRRITSLCELEVAICENEGIDRFEELELGPLIRHPLIRHYFSLGSDVTEVYKITSAEIISFLGQFMDSLKGKEVKADEFLDFLAKKLSVTEKEKLNVRVQSLGLYITYLRKARKRETDTLKKCLKGLKQRSDQKSSKYPRISSQKKQLDDRFSAISQRIESFSSGDQDFGGKHIRFISSSSESDNNNDSEHENNKEEKDEQKHSKFSLQKSKSSDRVSSCPYPSVSEEMTRLGLNTEMDGNHTTTSGGQMQSKKKRKFENVGCDISAPYKLLKRDRVEPHLPSNDGELKESGSQNETGSFLPDSSMELFITTWKDACREHNVTEVFERMLQFYEKKPRRRKRMKSIFSLFPYSALLNVAVTSIKCGIWNSMYDTFQALGPHEIEDALSKKYSQYESIEIEPDVKDAPVITEHVVKHNCRVTIEDIVKKVSEYFELDVIPHNVGSCLEKQFVLLRKLCKCELWLTEQFSVKEFESLGYGESLTFLEKHVPKLHNVLQKCLTGGTCEKSCLEVSMLPQQLSVLLSQASNSLWENKNISRQSISELLMRQFPSVSFKLVESGSVEDFLDNMRGNKSSIIPSCVLFSATLLEMCSTGDSRDKEEVDLSSIAEMQIGIGHKAGTFRPVATKDAIEALLMAPMLSDLGSWSHWDINFGPSLGPLVEWLLNEVNTKELLCLVTKDGKVVRINHAASIDSFLGACLKGSSFQTALELLSLLSLYGGRRHVPMSLLKCHARRALEVLVKNYTEIEVSDGQNISIHRNPVYRSQMLNNDVSCNFSSELNKSKSMVISGVPVASRFILDCLGHLPAEFRSFAADVLLSGLQSVIRDAPSAILCECKQIEHRLMLHELGLSLGVMEWISDYHVFCSSMANDFLLSARDSGKKAVSSELGKGSICMQGTLNNFTSREGEIRSSIPAGQHKEKHTDTSLTTCMVNNVEVCTDPYGDGRIRHLSEVDKDKEAAMVIESIRRQEFGLDQCLSNADSIMLKKQHARLGRALHCLSQELYSQDSHFLLELVQNADDNVYPENVEPTLTFILQEAGIIVLNNEQGFSAENIRALCDVGNSTKKGPNTGYIGKKGIGFKSVFRVTDAPEIHSNGFHVKFDISQGQIGFVLPTVVPPCDIDLYGRLLSVDTDQVDTSSWNTCIVLPFRSKLSGQFSMNNIVSMFSDLHPSLLLFLHHLQCIKFRNMLDDSLLVMRKEMMCDGITKVSLGKDKMTWLVASQKLQAGAIRPDVQTTKISIAFTLEESDNGDYLPHLDQQPVFAFLPLRKYGLKFILQGDFVLPSSREEVDGNSPWNQWLLSHFPELFVNAERSFCALACYGENPGKAVTAFMSFVPLVGEVHGFFSSLPRMIISKLRMSNCLLLEGNKNEWVPPCKVLRSWNEQARTLLPDSLLLEHLGLGFLDRDVVLSDSLGRALGIEEYGPKILLQIISSLCNKKNGLESVSLTWLSSWLNTLYTMLFHSSARASLRPGTESDLISDLKKIPFIPLSDGTYGSINEGTIWLSSDGLSSGFDNEYGADAFPKLYAKLRTVSTALFSAAAAVDMSCYDNVSVVDNITRMLHQIGTQRLSSHEILKVHILPAISDERTMVVDKNLMIEYLSFVMFHLQSSCPNCDAERGYIFSELYGKALILTNHGYKRPADVSIHFNKVYGSPIAVNKLIDRMDLKWHEVDVCYLNHPITELISSGVMKWRKFFQELGITDFVHVVSIARSITDISHVFKNMTWDIDLISTDPVAKDWESQELVHLLSELSSSGDRVKSMYLLEVFDLLWDDCFSDKVTGSCNFKSVGESRPFKSSFIRSLQDIRWIASSMDDELHYPKDLFCDCDAVRSILGATAPYAVPKIRSEKLLSDIGFKIQVNLNDILAVLQVWRRLETPFRASITQMSKFYTYLWNEMATSKQKIMEELCAGPFVFVPHSCGSRHDDVVLGVLLSPQEVYWQDPTGSVDQMKETDSCSGSGLTSGPLNKTLCNIYPSLHDFFVQDCGVDEIPSFHSYLQILQQLSSVTLPSQTAHRVFQVFVKWSDGLKSGLLGSEDFVNLKECLRGLEYTVLPVIQDKWVSLHPSFGIVCWCDDEKLKKEFKHFDDIDFLYFGELSDNEKEMLQAKVSVVLQTLGISALSEIVTREAIYYGPAEATFVTSLVNWALPYAQRYILNVHPDKYLQFKQSGFEKLNHLRIVVVERLFYRNIIKSSAIASKRRVECSCLLQGNVLYSTRESDSHSIFMELSRLLSGGTPELHLANFLHMITTMAESGSTEEQTEFFILNSQKMPRLPDGESVWALSSVVSLTENDQTFLTNRGSTLVNEQNSSKSKKKPGISSSWPPVDWKTAPGFGFARANGLEAQAAFSQPSSSVQMTVNDDSCSIVAQIDQVTQLDTDWTIKEDPVPVTTVCGQDYETLEDQTYEACGLGASDNDVFDSIDLVTPSNAPDLGSSNSSEKIQLSFGSTNAQQALLTGRLGEYVAFNYFITNVGKTIVKWVNEERETGLPYDIVIGEGEKSAEYIEVKTTKSARKDWFSISVREWQFAVEKGESFSIARVVLLGNNMARITVFKNPLRLSQLGKLQLAVMIPKQPKEFSGAS